jgi:hypothetical protein
MSENHNTIRDEYLDAAAGEAIGAAPPEETAGFTAPSTEETQAARELRETVARMAAASPYMSPPARLRGKILAATAPAAFRMEDYKKATRDDAKWWRYGVIAATLFLVAAAYYNVSMRNQLAAKDAEVAQLRQAVDRQNAALSMMVDPNTTKGTLASQGKVFAAYIADAKSGKAVLFAPRGLFADGRVPQLTISRSDGRKLVYDTIGIPVSGSEEIAPGPIETERGVIAEELHHTNDKPMAAGVWR